MSYVILTVVALHFLVGVLSQTDINSSNVTAEENNNSVATSLNLNTASALPSAGTNEETAPIEENSDSVEHSQHARNPTTTSTFPPLIHNSHPKDAATFAQSTVSTTQTTKVPITEEEKAVTEKSQMDENKPKGSSSIMLCSSVTVLVTSILIWKSTY
ncbi:hypothetical protein Trydic_g4418 [Trypoxylus dichotomus]